MATEEHPFVKVLIAEHAAIDARRTYQKRAPIALKVADWLRPPERRAGEADAPADPAPPKEVSASADPSPPMTDTVGVCLSGGGIRSAAFCMGALQALDAAKFDLPGGGKGTAFACTDYLSTVSGGGYIGACVSAAMATTGEFPFSGFPDTAAVGHLRDYSNYILPRGHKSLLDAVVVVLRGLVTNAVILSSLLLSLSTASLVVYPSRDSLGGRIFGDFAITVGALVTLGAALVGWALIRSRKNAQGDDIRGSGIKWNRRLLFLLGIALALDLYPLMLRGAFETVTWFQDASWFGDVKKLVVGGAASLSAVIAFFHDKIAVLLKSTSEDDGLGTLAKRVAAFLAIWFAALILPLLLLLVYFAVTVRGMGGGMAMGWKVPMAVVYGVLAAVLWGWTLRFAPNANSLHQLYRDKLSKAFLFNPRERNRRPAGPKPDDGDLWPLDRMRLDEICAAKGGPYHLINASINLQNSVHANRRGRDAGFFLFSPSYVGCDITDFVETKTLADIDGHIDLATAMAISGAAVSANMGRYSIPALAPTLALLNIRLGYWMRNPKDMLPARGTVLADVKTKLWQVAVTARRALGRLNVFGAKPRRGLTARLPQGIPDLPAIRRLRRRLSAFSKFYLLMEALGRLNEKSPLIYLTDGGHIENLGLYQLLKRRCRVIVAVDAEADPRMTFEALSRCQRYARIDMGIRINMPWREITKAATAYDAAIVAGKSMPESKGPHCAVGVIEYPGTDRGLLLYVKASMTGDEADYIQDYKRRQHSFPHEFTGDQFFSEEQFEVYRSLGFHALYGALAGGDGFAYPDQGPWSPSPTAGRSSEATVRTYLQARIAGMP